MADEVPGKPRKKLVFMTDRQKREMFERWDTGRYTHQELADWYGVTETTIRNLLLKRDELGPEEREAAVLFDALDLRNVEDSLAQIALAITETIGKVPRKQENLPLLYKGASVVLNIRKQLRELPKDLDDRTPAPIDLETTLKLAALIPPEKREEYLLIMRGLTQPQGKPESDLGRRKKPPVFQARPSPESAGETDDSPSPGEIAVASMKSEKEEKGG